MPRAGSGGHSSSASHHSSGGSRRSSSGHHVSSSSRSGGHRAGGGSKPSVQAGFGSPRRGPDRGPGPGPAAPPPHRGPGAPPPPSPRRGPGAPPPPPGDPWGPPPPPPRRRRWFGYHRHYSRPVYHVSALATGIAAVIIVAVAFAAIIGNLVLSRPHTASQTTDADMIAADTQIPQSTRVREKADTGLSFDSACIIDELDWFEAPEKAGKNLRDFYKATGLQPYIVLLKYQPGLTTDAEKDDYAIAYYDSHIDNEGTFLFVYFAEEDSDNDVGYMCCVNGAQADDIMDSEALEIFWAYIDQYWFSDLSTDELFETVFTKTAEAIM